MSTLQTWWQNSLSAISGDKRSLCVIKNNHAFALAKLTSRPHKFFQWRPYKMLCSFVISVFSWYADSCRQVKLVSQVINQISSPSRTRKHGNWSVILKSFRSHWTARVQLFLATSSWISLQTNLSSATTLNDSTLNDSKGNTGIPRCVQSNLSFENIYFFPPFHSPASVVMKEHI